MKWFERYGFLGLYFSSYIFLCVFSSYIDFKSDSPNINISTVLSVFAALSVPAGYILSIFSQWLYYKFFCFYHIHRYAMNSNEPEEILEGRMVKIFRISVHADNIEKCRWASEWISKRVDVIAINNSILTATIVAYFLSNILHEQLFQTKLPNVIPISIISIIIIAILILNTCLLVKQVKKFTKALYLSKSSFLNKKPNDTPN